MPDVRHYVTAAGVDVFSQWMDGLRDRQASSRVLARIGRLALGNFGDCKPVGGSVLELRIDWGPGYRVYCARMGQTVVLLLCGGDKRNQQRDIEDAKAYFEDYKARTSKVGGAGKKAGRGRKRIS
jgi:putative addiction module killer protein